MPLPLSLPPDLPTGEYEVILGLYDADSGERLPVSGNFDPASTAMRAIRVATLTYP
ncbi:hypothetical protein [Roseiflexus sp. RS-1]|uniref:hypothetical protein n=1 Tax=Roseiflexus sp. (strain RS-1) TaxID=357808 RepID=UPI0002DABDB3|nr:hypothetical protein [Roseiflexus sp. RS-1]